MAKQTYDEIAAWYRQKGEEQREVRALLAAHAARHPDCDFRCWEKQALEQRLDSANMGD